MQIDLTQVLTNVFGFVIVVLILRRLAWRPILDFLDARRDKIRKDYTDAEKAVADAEMLRTDFEHKLADIKSLERERVQEAVKRGEGVADGIVAEARGKAETTLAKAQADIAVEVEKAQIQLRDDVVQMAILAAEKVIGERLDDERHRRLIREYIDGLWEVRGA
jgi:F-type H+-transporting ATPase subunit b